MNMARYLRQILIDGIGTEGQEKLAGASVAVVGAGGLGSPALTYLAAAGIGRLKLIDFDTVDISNLNRQFLHSEKDIGRPKALSAKEKLKALNSEIAIYAHEELLAPENAEMLLAGCDVVLGAVDSIEARFVINKACTMLRIPYVDGGISGFTGSVAFVHPPKTPCLRCFFPETNHEKAPAGVLGASAGVIGAILANIALLILLGASNPLESKILIYDALRMSMDLIDIKRDECCVVCGGI